LPPKILAKPAVEKLLSYSFPGNIRELKSVIELAITISDSNEISDEDILLGNNTLIQDLMDKGLTMREYNKEIVKNYLEKYENNIKLVADKLDIGVATIYRMLKEENEN
jgi:transcriptional regulator with PAS, ATPase and Fis domain